MSIRWNQAYRLYDLIPMKNKSILPDEGFDRRLVEVGIRYPEKEPVTMQVWCKPKGRGHNSPHRVMVICKCGNDIPFGRMHQHFPKCEGTPSI